MTRTKADILVENGQAEWIRTLYHTPRGKERHRTEAAILLLPARRWATRPSTDDQGTMMTLQLVP